MRRGMLLACASALAVSGCGGTGAPPTATSTVTTTATVTATVTAAATGTVTPTSPVALPPAPAPSAQALTTTPLTTAPPPRLRLSVFSDGCGVIRSGSRPGAYQALTWVFRDADGFEVLGRNAEGETRYRYFQRGTYTVVLEAFGDDHYMPVSNTVTVHC